RIGVVVPSYNEEKLLKKTVDTLPDIIDDIIIVEDGSKDDTWKVAKELEKKNKKVIAIKNKENRGIGYSLMTGYKKAFEQKCDAVGIVAGDAQCDPDYIKPMLDVFIDEKLDYVKAN